MIIIAIISQVLLVLMLDLQIYRVYVRRSNKRWLRLLYIIQALFFDVLLMSSLLIAITIMGEKSLMIFMVWVIYLFMMGFFAKLGLSIFVSVRWIFQRFRPHKSYRGLTIAGVTLAALSFLTMIYGAAIGRNDLRVERIEIVSDKLPVAFDGFTIAQFSDTHIGNMGSQSALITRLVQSINRLSPDIVVQSGDLVNIVSGELNDWYVDQFSKIKPPVYAVLGNHDLGFYIRDTAANPPLASVDRLKAAQRAMGWTLLENERVFIVRGGDSIAVAGVTFSNKLSHNGTNSIAGGSNLANAMRGVSDSIYSILIAHTPSMFDSIPAIARPDLTLSGHVHSMQLKISIGDFSWSPANWLYPMYSGLYQDRGRYLYVNDGIGYVVYPMRIGAGPELTLFTLRRP